jgi:hypothetical protein
MRTSETILAEFDNPLDGMGNNVDSTVSSTRGRASLETLLDIRSFIVGIPATYDEETPVHIIGFIAEKCTVGSYAAVCYVDATGVLSIVSDLTKLVVMV